MQSYAIWTADDAARHIAVPGTTDDKYSRGVLGVITGSDRYPGAAVLGVDAALHTGVGMVRYLGAERPSSLVLQRRPEAVTVDGRVQAWLIGSGMDAADLHAADRDAATRASMAGALAQGLPTVLDGGALDLYPDATGPVVVTPHCRELARLLDVEPADIAADPAAAALAACASLGATVLLKGHTTFIAGGGTALSVTGAPSWLATAGAGDALGGILGALIATQATDAASDPAALARLAASASVIHSLAAVRAGGGGPFTVTALIEAIPATIAELLAR